MAFGRTRPDDTPVDRDFSDVILLFDRLGDQIIEEVANAPHLRTRIKQAAETLAGDPIAQAAAARELIATGEAETNPAAVATIARTTRDILRELE